MSPKQGIKLALVAIASAVIIKLFSDLALATHEWERVGDAAVDRSVAAPASTSAGVN